MEARLRHAERKELLFDGGGKVVCHRCAQPRELCGLAAELLLEHGNLLLKRGDVLVVVLNLRKLLFDLCLMREHVAKCRAVLLAEAVDDIHAALELIEALGAELDALAVVAQLVRRLLQGDVGLLNHLLGILQRIVEAADLLEVLLDLRERGQDAEAVAAAPLEELIRLLDGADDLLRVRELADVGFELLVLAGL